MNTLNFKEGQTYVCTKTDKPWWTEGKEYKVASRGDLELYLHDKLYLHDDDGDFYTQQNINNNNNTKFKLKEQPFDLNKLTTAQLREYVGLLEDKEKAESLLTDFIERVTK